MRVYQFRHLGNRCMLMVVPKACNVFTALAAKKKDYRHTLLIMEVSF